ncbi:MAG: carbamate kinase [bacterium]
MADSRTAVVALGGNAISQSEQEDTIANQFANTRQSLEPIVQLVRDGFNLVVTHGNGPQVGNAMLRIELSRGKAPILPLGIVVADTEGGMGYMIEQSLQNKLRSEKIDREVVTIISQMLVDQNDPAIDNPTKFVGQFYTEQEARERALTAGWKVRQDGDRGWRRVVPSPTPIRTIEAETIRALVENKTIVIAGGGGGIPVYIDEKGNYEGIDAVIDKDLASAVIAREIGADILAILTSVNKVAINFGRPDQKELDQVTLSEIQEYYRQGHFPPGSMGPKIEAAVSFLKGGGKMVTISSIADAREAVSGEAGTRIIPD